MADISKIPSQIIQWAMENPAKAKGYALLAYSFIMGWLLYLESLPNSIKFLIVIYFIAVILLVVGLICTWRDKFLWGLSVKIEFDPKNYPEHLQTEDFYTNGIVTHHENFVRVKVTNTKKKPIKCKASVLQIEGLAEYSPCTISKSLTWKSYENKGDEEIELLYNNPLLINVATINSIDNRLLFFEPAQYPAKIINRALSNVTTGKYIITINVYADNQSADPYKIGLELNGVWHEAKGFNP
jgi:hypothetical protein